MEYNKSLQIMRKCDDTTAIFDELVQRLIGFEKQILRGEWGTEAQVSDITQPIFAAVEHVNSARATFSNMTIRLAVSYRKSR